MFPKATLTVLLVGGSDHSLILLSTYPKNHKLPHPFKFHNMWLRGEACEDFIKRRWRKTNGVNVNNINSTLTVLSKELFKWNKEKIGKIDEVIEIT